MGSTIKVEGPSGSFILDEHEKGPHVFIAGGIGITPFRSMLRYVLDKNLPFKIHLIYSNSTIQEIIFQNELEHYADLDPNFKLTLTITKPQNSKQQWLGTTGRIDSNLINNAVGEYIQPTYWICGPPLFVDNMKMHLADLHIAKSKIRTDTFTGY